MSRLTEPDELGTVSSQIIATATQPQESHAPKRVMGFVDLLLCYVVTGISLRWIVAAAMAGPSSVVIWFCASIANESYGKLCGSPRKEACEDLSSICPRPGLENCHVLKSTRQSQQCGTHVV